LAARVGIIRVLAMKGALPQDVPTETQAPRDQISEGYTVVNQNGFTRGRARAPATRVCLVVSSERTGEPHAGERHYRGEQQCGERRHTEVFAGPRTKQDREEKRWWPDR
jgi:hypothetical protein